MNLKESTVRGRMYAYNKELSHTGKFDGTSDVTIIPNQRRGQPLLLSSELEEEVKAFIHNMSSSGGVVNAPITAAVRGQRSNHCI